MKKILYVDMDNVLVDFPSGIQRISPELYKEYADNLDDAPGIFSLMNLIKDALGAYEELSRLFETYTLRVFRSDCKCRVACRPNQVKDTLHFNQQHTAYI
jgi:hypothetical protein